MISGRRVAIKLSQRCLQMLKSRTHLPLRNFADDIPDDGYIWKPS